jgi:hypothetical protein
MYGKRKAAEILTDSHRYINVLKFRCCKVNHFRGDTQMKNPPMRHAPRAQRVLSIMKRCEVITCSGHGAAWSGGGVEFIKQ